MNKLKVVGDLEVYSYGDSGSVLLVGDAYGFNPGKGCYESGMIFSPMNDLKIDSGDDKPLTVRAGRCMWVPLSLWKRKFQSENRRAKPAQEG